MSRDQISLPSTVNAFRMPTPGHHPDMPAVGDRRRRGHVLLALHVVGVGERPLPGDRLRPPVHRPQLQLAAVGRRGDVQKDPVSPDDRRRSAVGGQRQPPGDVLGRDVRAGDRRQRPALLPEPAAAARPWSRRRAGRSRRLRIAARRPPRDREAGLQALSVVGRTAPVRPVGGDQDVSSQTRQQACHEERKLSSIQTPVQTKARPGLHGERDLTGKYGRARQPLYETGSAFRLPRRSGGVRSGPSGPPAIRPGCALVNSRPGIQRLGFFRSDP